ncbi:hypothetical protein ABLV94_07335 [Staphylococcus sp. Mo2-7]
MAKQSAKFELFNYLFKSFRAFGVPVVRTKELHQELPYPFIVLEDVEDSIGVMSIDNYSGTPTVRAHLWCTEDDLAGLTGYTYRYKKLYLMLKCSRPTE